MQLKKYYFLLFLISLPSCSTMDYRGEDKFKPRIKAFAYAMRWSQFEKAQGFIQLRNATPLQHNLEDLRQIKITKYEPLSEISRNVPDQDSADIISTYSIDYYHKGSYSIKHQRYEQVWWYDETIGTWFVDSNLPTFEH